MLVTLPANYKFVSYRKECRNMTRCFLHETNPPLDSLLPSPPHHMQCWCGKNRDIYCSRHHSGPDACWRDSWHQRNSNEDEREENVHGSDIGKYVLTYIYSCTACLYTYLYPIALAMVWLLVIYIRDIRMIIRWVHGFTDSWQVKARQVNWLPDRHGQWGIK